MGTKIETDIIYIPTDSKQYLLFNSCHPKHMKTSIPYSLARRILTVASNVDTLHIRMNELKTALTHQKYPKRIIENSIEKAMSINKSEKRTSKRKAKRFDYYIGIYFQSKTTRTISCNSTKLINS